MIQIFPSGEGETNASVNATAKLASPFSIEGNPGADSIQGWSTTAPHPIVVSESGILANLYIKLDATYLNSYTVVVVLNGVETLLTATISAGGISAFDSVNAIAITAGDTLSLKQTGAGGNSESPKLKCSLQFTPTIAGTAIIASTNRDLITPSGVATNFDHIYAGQGWNATESSRYFHCPTSGIITAFYVKFQTAMGNTWTGDFYIYKNGVQQASSKLSFTATDTAKSVTGVSIAFSVGDTLTIGLVTTGNDDGGQHGASWSISYQPTVDGDMMIGGKCNTNLSNIQNTEQFGFLVGSGSIRTSELVTSHISGGSIELKNFRIDLSVAPGASQSRDFRIRKNSGNANSYITISGTGVTGTDNSNRDSFTQGDLIGIYHKVISASPATTIAYWSAVLNSSVETILARPMYFK